MAILGNFGKISFAGCNRKHSWPSKILHNNWIGTNRQPKFRDNRQNVALYTMKSESVKFNFNCDLVTIMMYSHVFKVDNS